MKILVVEDEARIAAFVRDGLQEKGFAVETCGDGESGLARALEGEFDALVLDIMLPGIDGLGVLREVRKSGKQLPVVLLTARDSVDDRVAGLDLGADDYVTKPFYIDELVARLRAVTRRGAASAINVLTAGAVTMNRMSREVTAAGKKVTLTAREFSLLEFLMRSPGTVVTRAQILERVWEYHFDPQTNIVDVYITRLRTRLADAGVAEAIETVRGVGYRFRPDAA